MSNQASNQQIQFKTLKIQKDSINQESNYFKKEFDYLQKLFEPLDFELVEKEAFEFIQMSHIVFLILWRMSRVLTDGAGPTPAGGCNPAL